MHGCSSQNLKIPPSIMFGHSSEPTGADSPSQNGVVEIYNDKLGIRTQSLLYGSGLPAKYWSAALIHAVYLHNRLVHSVMLCTPFESYYDTKPDLQYLKTFGSWVCVKHTGNCRAKLDRHDSVVFFLDTRLLTRISFIWIWIPDWLSVAIMPV